MGEPTVRRCSMPMLHACRNIDGISRCHADQNLSAVLVGMMDVPVVPALIWTPSPLFPKNTAFNGMQNCVLCIFSIFYFNLAYSSGSTGSNHSLDAPSAGTSTARCWNQLSFAAPCQCFTSGGMFTTSPACSSCTGLPHS